MQLRKSPSGSALEGEAEGDFLAWDEEARQWFPTEPPESPFVSTIAAVVFVQNGNASEDPTGSAVNPFGTLQAGIDACPEGGTVFVSPGDYSGEALAFDKSLSIVGMTANARDVILGAITVTLNPRLCLRQVVVSAAIDVGGGALEAYFSTAQASVQAGSVVGETSTFQGTIAAASMTLTNCRTEAEISCTGTLVGKLCTFVGPLTTPLGLESIYELESCSLDAAVACFDLRARNTAFSSFQVDSVIDLRGCSTEAASACLGSAIILDSTIADDLAITLDLTTDRSTYYGALNRTTVTVGGTLTIEDLISATLQVIVPAVVADGVGYANVSTVGSALEGLPVNTPILANPTSDLVAAGAGGGFINARVSAANTIRCAFNGALAGGAANFVFTRI